MSTSRPGRRPSARSSGKHLLLLAVLVAVLSAASMAPSLPSATARAAPPNIVLITADDMTDYELRWMPETRRLLRDRGFEFTDFISPHPLCCPARAEILTGQYAHNNGVHDNRGERGGDALVDPDNNVGAWLQEAGYRTAFVGKWLNRFHRFPVAGWDHLNYSERGTYSPWGFKFSEDPTVNDTAYMSDYIGRRTIQYVKESTALGRPFFIWASHLAPHGMKVDGRWVDPVPATRHRDLYPDTMPPSLSKPSFNEADVSDKPERVQVAPRDVNTIVSRFRARIRSLRAVDEQIGRLVRHLTGTGQMANTVVIFTSDNGFLLGEHRLNGKNLPYEEALQVPLLMRGPGIPQGSSAATATLVDLAATITDLAGATAGRRQDGTSLIPGTVGREEWGPRLIEAFNDADAWFFHGVRDSRWTYAEHSTGEVELYDRAADPFQLTNLAGQRPEELARLAAQLDTLRYCAGATCRSSARP